MSEIYRQSKDELLKAYGGGNGHSEERAAELLQEYGQNALEEKGEKSPLQIFFEQFADLLVIILLIAAAISIVSGNVESTIVIIIVLVLNAILGTVQYVKAEKSLASLKALSSPKTKVVRDGRKKEIDSRNIVPGDLLVLEAGDMVVADGRVIDSYSLQVNESSLTGESANVEKKDIEIEKECALGDRINMVYSGSLVTYGRANVLVTGTGMNTEMGKIATLMNETQSKKTPLQRSLDEFSKRLAAIIMVISLVVFGLRIWQGNPVLDSMMFAVALAVAAIPEALGSIVTIVQAMGTRKMAADNAIIKDLKAVESLGCVSIMCSDKTGTLTQNKMTVEKVYADGCCIEPENMDREDQINRLLLYNCVLNTDGTISSGAAIGDPTETCLLELAEKNGFLDKDHTEESMRNEIPRISELPFDSDRKLMSSQYEIKDNCLIFTKGAVDTLLERTSHIAETSGVRPITEEDKKRIEEQNQSFSEEGLRVLAFAYRSADRDERLDFDSEKDFIFLGLVAIIDPPRVESAEAVKNAISAGIKPIMITGDHKVTARAIAEKIGIFNDGDMALTGQELDSISDEKLDQILEKVSVYARVSPEHKIRIVDAWQKQGKIVAMTGDGVNDAPALKKADIGVAMGITGTEVSKDAAAMILEDDNFATMIKAVLNGRNVYRNIMNSILFLLSGNMAAIMVVVFCSLMALSTPFEAVHLLFINLLTDSLPALAIGMEPADSTLLQRKPRNPREGILTKSVLTRLFAYGFLIGAVTQIAFFEGNTIDAATASTMAFATLTLARLFHGFSCRSQLSITKIGLKSNIWSVSAFLLGTVLLSAVLFIPFMQKLFMTASLDATQIGLIVLLAFIPTFIIQIGRIVREM